MNRSARRTKRSVTREKPKNLVVNRSANLRSSRMDVCFADDSNDSGFDIDSRSQMPNRRHSITTDSYDQSSDDLGRDSSDDSIDSGIFGVTSGEEQSTLDALPNADARVISLEDSGLANLLCQSISISEENKINSEELFSEPPNKRRCIVQSNGMLVEKCLLDQTPDLPMQMNAGTSQINLLGIASQAERPQLTANRASSNNGDSMATNQVPGSRRKLNRKPPSLHVTYPNRLRDGQIDLRILSQPEEQHRARYMTEGSRGAIKDRRGSGFPTVKLFGYNQPVTLQVFIGTDQGKIQPHLFYQACKVSGKNCTPCTERVIDGTTVIEISMLPDKDMTVSCDCIGILKERNVDVEQRLPYFNMTRAKKKNTRCRMVFRVSLTLAESGLETLQAASSPILCTQPPGVPEICKKSIKECSVVGGTELFIIGKNFLKDTKIVFEEEMTDAENELSKVWQEIVDPEKEFLHQTHLVCRVPSYRNQGIVEPMKVHLTVQSGGKTSEPHTFIYLPAKQGSAVDNRIGNIQNVTSSAPGSIELGRQLSRSHLMPAFIQVSGGIATSTVPAIVVSQSNGVVTLPRGTTRDTALRPNVSHHQTGNVHHKPLKTIVSGPGNQNDNSYNSNQIHVVVVQQNDKNGKRIHSLPSHGNRFRSSFPGKRLNRFGHRGKLLNASRGKLHTPRNGLNTDSRATNTASMEILKQELIGEQIAASSEITNNQVDNQRDPLLASAAVLNQSPVFPADELSSSIGNNVEQHLPIFTTSSTINIPPEVDSIVQSQIFQPQPVDSHCLLPENVLPVHSESADHLGAIDINSSSIMQANIMSNAEIQSMIENDTSALQQQNVLIGGNGLLQSETALVGEQKIMIQPQIHQIIENVSGVTTASSLTTADCQSLQMKPMSNELHSTMAQNDLLHTPGGTAVLCSALDPIDLHSGGTNRSSDANAEFSQREITPQEFLHAQGVCLSGEVTLPVEIIHNSDMVQGTSLNVPIKSELESPTHTPISHSPVQLNQIHGDVITSTCTNVPIPQRPPLQLHLEQQMHSLASTEGSTTLSPSVSTPNSIITPLKAGIFLNQVVALNSLQQQQLLQQLQLQQQQQQHQNGIGLTPTPTITDLVRTLQFSKVNGVTDVKRERPNSSDHPQCEMNSFQSTMTSALSMLSESDLLSLINPSTFDNV